MSTRFVSALLVAFTLALCSAAESWAQSETASTAAAKHNAVIKTLTTNELMAIMEEEGCAVEPYLAIAPDLLPTEGIKWRMLDYIAIVEMGPGSSSIKLSAVFPKERLVEEKRVDRFGSHLEQNERPWLSRSYLNDAGDPVLQFVLDLNGGVTIYEVKRFLMVYLSTLMLWRMYVII